MQNPIATALQIESLVGDNFIALPIIELKEKKKCCKKYKKGKRCGSCPKG